jgi:hypothetical protein
MRKLALLFAAALFVSVPLIAATPTITYAAAKKKSAAPKGESGGEGAASRSGEDLNEVNSRFWRALNDLGMSLTRPWPAGGEDGGAAPAAPKGKNGKRSRAS